MTNLIPPQAKQIVKREYIFRVLIVWALLIGGVCIAVASMLVPTLLLLKDQAQALELERRVSTSETQYDDLRQTLERANTIATQLNREADGVPASRVFERVRVNLSSQVSMQGFSYVNSSEGMQVQVRGVATTRNALAAFVQELEDDPLFVQATVPVSDLAKDVDASFTATLVVRASEEE